MVAFDIVIESEVFLFFINGSYRQNYPAYLWIYVKRITK